MHMDLLAKEKNRLKTVWNALLRKDFRDKTSEKYTLLGSYKPSPEDTDHHRNLSSSL